MTVSLLHSCSGRMDSYVDTFMAAGGSMITLAKGNRSKVGCMGQGGLRPQEGSMITLAKGNRSKVGEALCMREQGPLPSGRDCRYVTLREGVFVLREGKGALHHSAPVAANLGCPCAWPWSLRLCRPSPMPSRSMRAPLSACAGRHQCLQEARRLLPRLHRRPRGYPRSRMHQEGARGP